MSSIEGKQVHGGVSSSLLPHYGFDHIECSSQTSVARDISLQLLCFGDKETGDLREKVGRSNHMVKSVAEQKVEMRIRTSS